MLTFLLVCAILFGVCNLMARALTGSIRVLVSIAPAVIFIVGILILTSSF